MQVYRKSAAAAAPDHVDASAAPDHVDAAAAAPVDDVALAALDVALASWGYSLHLRRVDKPPPREDQHQHAPAVE